MYRIVPYSILIISNLTYGSTWVWLVNNISTKVLKTQSFLELQTPDFAWKFICTVQPNEKVQKYKKYKSTKVQKYKSTKVQKYKSTNVQKNALQVWTLLFALVLESIFFACSYNTVFTQFLWSRQIYH